MNFSFHDPKYSRTYAMRNAHNDWTSWINQNVIIKGKKVIDLGCGGGIYTKALAELDALEVIGIDFSAAMLEGARGNNPGLANVRFQLGDAYSTGLQDGCADIVLERALIHHITDLAAAFREAYRLLTPGGMLIVQDRTVEDCLLPGSMDHLRGYFFSAYPRLVEKETSRRPEGTVVLSTLSCAGFTDTRMESIWETRAEYSDLQRLRQDLLSRAGRSILHDLTDAELAELVELILISVGDAPVAERDRWTIWTARKPA